MAFDTSAGRKPRGVGVSGRLQAERISGLLDAGTLVFPSNLGWMAAVWHAERLYRLAFGFDSRPEALAAAGERTAGKPSSWRPFQRTFIERMQAVACGETDDLSDIDVDLDDRTDFQRAVLEQCRQIRRGSVCTYAELARLAGHAGSARAVGNVMATNRLPLVIPCHRVIGSGGKLGGFSAPQGLSMKVRLLEMEGCRTSRVPQARRHRDGQVVA